MTILFHEVWPYHAAHVERRDRYRPSIREFVDLAEEVHDPAAYEAAQARRAEMTARWRSWFADHDVDLLLEPTVPITAFARGHGYDSGNLGGEGDPLIVLTSTWNFTGFPVVALPAGLGARSGLPVGVSLIGPPDAEPLLVQAAIDLQEHELPPLRPRRRAADYAAASSSRAWRRAPTSSASAPSMRTSSATTSPEPQLADRRARRLGARCPSRSRSGARRARRSAAGA